jgi:DNA-directed RNA polymerase subunit RPC12/RpoP
MALINCPECGKEISDRAVNCPNCGVPLRTDSQHIPAQKNIRKDTDVILCPKCHSTNLHVDKKGFSGGKAVAGVVTFGMIGTLAGTIGSNDIEITCLNCGKKFDPASIRAQKQREQMAKDNPAGMLIISIGCALAVGLLFIPGVSIWWSLASFFLAIILPLFTGHK